MTKAYKLLRLRKDGTLGSLFINRRFVIPVGEWLDAEDHPTRGYAHRPGWHCVPEPVAPHLTKRGRVWAAVSLRGVETIERPESQGGTWFLGQSMKVARILEEEK